MLKQKGAYPYEYMNSFKRFNEKKLPARKYFFSSTKKERLMMMMMMIMMMMMMMMVKYQTVT